MSLAKLLDPHVWPSIQTQLVFLPALLLAQQVVDLKWSLLFFALFIIVICLRIKTLIDDRLELFKIFDKGKIPSVEHKNLFSGNLFEVLAPRDNLFTIDRLHKRLGKTFGMFYADDPFVFTTDLDLLLKIFITDGTKNIDRNRWRMPFIKEFNESLASVQGDEWRNTRRLLGASFTSKQMHSDNVFRDVELAVEGFLSCISGHQLEQDGDITCRLIDVNYNFKKFSGDVIFRVAYGTENGINMMPNGRDKLIDVIEEGADHIRGPVTWASIMFESSQKILGALVRFTPINTYIQYIHSVLDKSLRERHKLSTSSQTNKIDRKMIDSIIESFAKGHMSEERLRANLFFIFIAGFETSANTLTIVFWLLATHQEIQDKLRKAIAAEGEKAEYLDWCIRETLRLYPAVPTAIGRTLHENIHWKGQTFFAGTTVNASIYSIHHSAAIWGPDVEEFKPERFAKASSFHPVQEFSFGHGPRYCLGRMLANFEIKALIPRLLLRYRVEASSNTPKTLHFTSPNIIHMIIHGKVELRFIELSSL